MQITRNSLNTVLAPADQSTGDVYLDMIGSPSDASRLGAAVVHFTPGARSTWHTHPHGQTIWVSEGVGLCQREGGPVEMIRAGDRVFFEPGENHWHGAPHPVHGARRHPPGRQRRELRRLWRTRQRRAVRSGAFACGRRELTRIPSPRPGDCGRGVAQK